VFYCQVGTKCFDFLTNHLLTMSLVMINNVSDNPAYITLLGKFPYNKQLGGALIVSDRVITLVVS
jgi:hypothetical protein